MVDLDFRMLWCVFCLFVLKIFDTLIFGQFSVLKTLLILKKGKASNSTEQNPLESLLTQIF